MRQRAERQPRPVRQPAEDMIFATFLKAALTKSRMTGAELAERADVSKAAMYFYLDGSRIPGPEAVQKICGALHVPVESVPAFTSRLVGRPAHRKVAANA